MELRVVSKALEPLRAEAHHALAHLSPDDPSAADWMLAAARLDAALDATEHLLAVHDPAHGRRRWASRPLAPAGGAAARRPAGPPPEVR